MLDWMPENDGDRFDDREETGLDRPEATVGHEHVDVFERVALTLASRGSAMTSEEGVELGRALGSLVARLERAADTLRQVAEMVNPDVLPRDLPLTSRELEMLTHLAEGRSNAEIARRCWISENTVKFHLKNLFRKLSIQDRAQAMTLARAITRRMNLGHRPAAPDGGPAAPGAAAAPNLKEILEKLV
ncbi:MAG: helix-turn-helix transcriptional regulator [Armatimonadetes bacterium]|nr:helix-turn-helix transcriptional regulator [Armatimonadota bacterium]